MHDLPLTQEFQAVLDIHVVGHVDEPLVCSPRFLFGRNVLVQVGDGIAFGLDVRRRPRYSCRVLIKQRLIVVYIIGSNPAAFSCSGVASLVNL